MADFDTETNDTLSVPEDQGAPDSSFAPTEADVPSVPSIADYAQQRGVGKVDTRPPGWVAKFKTGEGQNIKTVRNLVDALDPSSRDSYIKWWEQQHGDVNQVYDNVVQQIGAQPKSDGPMSKKEKFTYLLEFGLSMMKNQGAQPMARVGAAVQAGLGAVDRGRAAEQSQWAERRKAAAAERDAALRSLGTPGQALTTQSTLNRNAAEADAARARAAASSRRPAPKTLETDSGIRQFNDQTGRWELVTDEQGKPVRGVPKASAGGRGGSGGSGARPTDYDKKMTEYERGHPKPDPKDVAATQAWHVRALEYVTGRMIPRDRISQMAYLQAIKEVPIKEFSGSTDDYVQAIDERAQRIADAIRGQQPTGQPAGVNTDPLGIRRSDPLGVRSAPTLTR